MQKLETMPKVNGIANAIAKGRANAKAYFAVNVIADATDNDSVNRIVSDKANDQDSWI